MKDFFKKIKESCSQFIFNLKTSAEERVDGKIAQKQYPTKEAGKFKKWLLRVGDFAKRKPSLFIAIILGIIFILLFVTYESLHMTSTPSFCGKCHVEVESGPGAEFHSWNKNVHSFVEVGCIDCHGKPGIVGYMRAKMGGMYDLYGEVFHSKEHKMEILTKGATDMEYAKNLVPNDWCLICHSDDNNQRIRDEHFMSFLGVEMRKVDGVKNPEFREENGLRDIFNDEMANINFSHESHVNGLELSCMNCHMGVAHSGEFKSKPKMETCFACHDAEREKNADIGAPLNEDCASCHKTVVEFHEGTLLLNEGEEPTPPTMMVDMGVYGAENCASCHSEGAFAKPTRATCGTTCHGEVDYGDIYDDIRARFDEAKAPLDKLYMSFYKSYNKMNKDQKVLFNQFKEYYELLANDASKGIHNEVISTKAAEKAMEVGKELANSLGIPVAAEEEKE